MKVNLSTKKRARIEMLPLIDIVFLLLVFFIYAMLSMAVHRGLEIRLPVSSSVRIEKYLTLSVTVKADGSVYVDKQRVSTANLTAILADKAAKSAQTGILLFADRGLSYQKLFGILDRIKQAGIQQISLQAEVRETG